MNYYEMLQESLMTKGDDKGCRGLAAYKRILLEITFKLRSGKYSNTSQDVYEHSIGWIINTSHILLDE